MTFVHPYTNQLTWHNISIAGHKLCLLKKVMQVPVALEMLLELMALIFVIWPFSLGLMKDHGKFLLMMSILQQVD